jgi:hypothetical protein
VFCVFFVFVCVCVCVCVCFFVYSSSWCVCVYVVSILSVTSFSLDDACFHFLLLYKIRNEATSFLGAVESVLTVCGSGDMFYSVGDLSVRQCHSIKTGPIRPHPRRVRWAIFLSSVGNSKRTTVHPEQSDEYFMASLLDEHIVLVASVFSFTLSLLAKETEKGYRVRSFIYFGFDCVRLQSELSVKS